MKLGDKIAERLTMRLLRGNKARPRLFPRLANAFLALILAAGLAFPGHSLPAQPEYELIIEDFHSQKVLWRQPMPEGEELIYLHNHSVYGVEVAHRYAAGPQGRLLLLSVRSLCFALFSPYPGYDLDPGKEKADSQGICEVKINRIHDPMVLAVGDELTAKRFLLGGRLIQLNKLGPKVSVIKVRLKKKLACNIK